MYTSNATPHARRRAPSCQCDPADPLSCTLIPGMQLTTPCDHVTTYMITCMAPMHGTTGKWHGRPARRWLPGHLSRGDARWLPASSRRTGVDASVRRVSDWIWSRRLDFESCNVFIEVFCPNPPGPGRGRSRETLTHVSLSGT